MQNPEPQSLPTAASKLLVHRPVGRLGQLQVEHPGRFLKLSGFLAAAFAAAGIGMAAVGQSIPPLGATILLFAAIDGGLGRQASWRTTAGSFVPAAASAAWLVPAYPAFGMLLLGLLAGWAAGAGSSDKVTRASVALGVPLGGVLGNLIANQLLGSSALVAVLPPVVLMALAGAAQGAMIGLGTLPRHLPLERDPVELLYEESRVLPGAEMRDYLERSMKLYRQISACLRDGISLAREEDVEHFRDDLTQLMTAMFRLGHRWREIELFLEQADAGTTRQRLKAAEEKLGGLSDAYARRQYEQVAESLKRRLGHLDEMVSGRERVIGSLSYYFTTLEDMLLSLMRLKASDAQSTSLQLNTLAGRVRALNGEMEATARSVEELDFGQAGGAAQLTEG